MPPFAQFLRHAQISILEILKVFLWLKFSPSLNLNQIGHSSKSSREFPDSIIIRRMSIIIAPF